MLCQLSYRPQLPIVNDTTAVSLTRPSRSLPPGPATGTSPVLDPGPTAPSSTQTRPCHRRKPDPATGTNPAAIARVPTLEGMSFSARTHHKPAVMPPELLDREAPGSDPAHHSEAAHLTAHAIVHQGRSGVEPEVLDRLIKLADSDGLLELAELWSASSAVSLPGTLWRLYVLRRAVMNDAHRWSALFRAGMSVDDVTVVVAGVADPPGPTEVVEVTTAILTGAYTGDFAVALERAAAFCRLVAAGQAAHADSAEAHATQHARALTESSRRLASTASDLVASAEMWRRNQLE